jgi:hypothetical protein
MTVIADMLIQLPAFVDDEAGVWCCGFEVLVGVVPAEEQFAGVRQAW